MAERKDIYKTHSTRRSTALVSGGASIRNGETNVQPRQANASVISGARVIDLPSTSLAMGITGLLLNLRERTIYVIPISNKIYQTTTSVKVGTQTVNHFQLRRSPCLRLLNLFRNFHWADAAYLPLFSGLVSLISFLTQETCCSKTSQHKMHVIYMPQPLGASSQGA